MMKQRLDRAMSLRKLVDTRSQAESWIRMGKVMVDGRVITKAGHVVHDDTKITLDAPERYVSRAGLKLASVADLLKVNFADKVVLDVGSSTGGFTDYALQHGARKIYAVDVGTEQLHESLRGDERIELHEKTDIRDFTLPPNSQTPTPKPDIVVIDVSFISLREILPHVAKISSPSTAIIAMVKPQFEAGRAQVSKGIVKNNTVRREILKEFEIWAKRYFMIVDKADSEVIGKHGNHERFYKLRVLD